MTRIEAGPKRLAVAVCTYNRAESLRQTLDSFLGQGGVDTTLWELWVVDNNSSDHTRTVCESYSERLPVRYLFEGEQGLSAARNAVIQESSAEYFYFTDDDVTLSDGWLAEVFRAIERYPDASYFGGKILPRWDLPRPKWLRQLDMPLLSSLYCYYNPGDAERVFNERDPIPFGANMGFRASALRSAGKFRTELGPCGTVPGRGDDAEMIRRMRSMKLKGVYLPGAVVYHEFSPARFSPQYLYRYGVEKGRAARLMDGARGGSRRAQLAYAVKGLGQLVRGRGDRFRQCVINVGIQSGLMMGPSVKAGGTR